jgi:hypothetical protein
VGSQDGTTCGNACQRSTYFRTYDPLLGDNGNDNDPRALDARRQLRQPVVSGGRAYASGVRPGGQGIKVVHQFRL